MTKELLDDAEESARRLRDYVDILTPTQPLMVTALERIVRAVMVEQTRQRIIDRLGRFSPEQVYEADVVTQQIERGGL